MTGFRIVIVVAALLIASPLVLTKVWGVNLNFWVTQVTDKNDETVLRDGPQSPLAWLGNRVDVRNTFTTDAITSKRYVTITELIEMDDLLADQEPMPDLGLVPLYAAARAPARIVRYCAEVLQTIGTSCDVIYTETRQQPDGRQALTGRLAYLPAYSMGDLSSVENGAMISASLSFPYEGLLRPANGAAPRTAMMLQAQSMCDTLRQELGNCVLTRLRFDLSELWIKDLEVQPAGTNAQRIAATAEFTVYADETVLGPRGLQTKVSALINPS